MAPRRKIVPLRETIKYPRIEVKPGADPCRDKSLPCEHALDCGHLVTAPKPNEPCAPNCYHNAALKERKNTKVGRWQTLKFYCDACIETACELTIVADVSSSEAESIRAIFRQQEAARHDKERKFRKCYIAWKTISIPCDEEGDILSGYHPLENSHPFDTATPRTGPNMFEDVDIDRSRTKNATKRDTSKKTTPQVRMSDVSRPEDDVETEDDTSSNGEIAAEDLQDTLVEGARRLNEQESLVRRRQEEITSSFRTRRTAARPIVVSSSPASFVGQSSSSSPLLAHSSLPNSVQSPQTPTQRTRQRAKDNTREGTGNQLPAKRARANHKANDSLKRGHFHTNVIAPAHKGRPKTAKNTTTPPSAATKPPLKRACRVL